MCTRSVREVCDHFSRTKARSSAAGGGRGWVSLVSSLDFRHPPGLSYQVSCSFSSFCLCWLGFAPLSTGSAWLVYIPSLAVMYPAYTVPVLSFSPVFEITVVISSRAVCWYYAPRRLGPLCTNSEEIYTLPQYQVQDTFPPRLHTFK